MPIKRINLILVDYQRDFCDPSLKNPMYIPGAQEDIVRITEWISKNIEDISTITLTQDNHPLITDYTTTWPDHCLQGSLGQTIHPLLYATVQRWAKYNKANPVFITKGENQFVDEYAASEEHLKRALQRCASGSKLYVAGEALSHCVAATVNRLRTLTPQSTRILLLEDCCSMVPNTEPIQIVEGVTRVFTKNL